MTRKIPMPEVHEFVGGDGSLERRVSQGGWRAPSVVVLDESKEWLLWGALPEKGPWTSIKHPKEGMLEEFLELGDADPKRILRYSRKWGVLMRCKHGLPFTFEIWGLKAAKNEACGQCHQLFL